MSYKDIKKLFEQEKSLKTLSSINSVSIKEELESLEYVETRTDEQNRYIPNVEYNKPEEFAFYGSAEEYYEHSFEYIRKTYPYDGSLYEKQTWHNTAPSLDNYIFDNHYPRTTGYINFCAGPNGWGTQATTLIPSDLSPVKFA